MNKKDFMSLEEYKKELSSPKPVKSDKPKSIKIAPKEEPDDEPMAMDDAYEVYKLEWMIDNNLTIYDLVESIVAYAVDNDKVKDLLEDPTVFVSDWETKAGFGDSIYEDYDSWLLQESADSEDNLDNVADIIDLFDVGLAADEIEAYGYSPKDVELATAYYNSMGMSVAK